MRGLGFSMGHSVVRRLEGRRWEERVGPEGLGGRAGGRLCGGETAVEPGEETARRGHLVREDEALVGPAWAPERWGGRWRQDRHDGGARLEARE
jgi:hypothetical protein